MENRYLYLLAEFDQETNKKINEVQSVIQQTGLQSKQSEGLPHHITLGCYAVNREIEVKELLKEVKEHFKQIEVEFRTYGRFGNRVLFLKPEENETLVRLHQFINRNCITFHEEWDPHVTLFIGEESELNRAIPLPRNKIKKLIGRIERIGLYELFPIRFIESTILDE